MNLAAFRLHARRRRNHISNRLLTTRRKCRSYDFRHKRIRYFDVSSIRNNSMRFAIERFLSMR